MADTNPHHVFLSYNRTNLDFVESLAARLREANVSLWFSPWHAIPGRPVQEQMEQALRQASVSIVFIGGGSGSIQGWQNEEMRTAIQTRVEDEPDYRIIPVFVPGVARPNKRDLPRFLRRYFREELIIEFSGVDDEQAFKRLLAGIWRIAPIEVEDYLQAVEKGEVTVLKPGPVGDSFSRYETGLGHLMERLGVNHPRYSEALVYQQRLAENIDRSRRYGDTGALKAERSEIIDRLNNLALSGLDVPFSELCGLPALAAKPDNPGKPDAPNP